MNIVPLSKPPVVRAFTVALDNGKLKMIVEETVTTTYRIVSIDAVAQPPVVSPPVVSPPVVPPPVVVPPIVAPPVVPPPQGSIVVPTVGGDVVTVASWKNGELDFTNGDSSPIGDNEFASSQVIPYPASPFPDKFVLRQRIDTQQGNRAEGTGARLLDYQTDWKYPELWYTVFMFLPQEVAAPDWWNVWQWKSAGAGGKNDPVMILNIEGSPTGVMKPYVYHWTAPGKVYDAPAGTTIPVATWVRWDMRHKPHVSAGLLEVYLNKTKIIDIQDVPTMPNGSIAFGVSNYSLDVKNVVNGAAVDGPVDILWGPIIRRKTKPTDLP